MFPRLEAWVVSLPEAALRREHVQQELGRHGIPFVFFDACKPEQASGVLKKLGIVIAEGALTGGEIACLSSHVSLWAGLVASDAAAALILEDDVFLGQNAERFLTRTDWIPNPLEEQLIKLEKLQKHCLLSLASISIDGRKLYRLRQNHFGCAAYILGRVAAQRLLDFLRSAPVQWPIDDLMFEDYRQLHAQTVWQLHPAVCLQEKELLAGGAVLGSHLEDDRAKRWEVRLQGQTKPAGWQRHQRLLRLAYWKRKAQKVIYSRKMRFM